MSHGTKIGEYQQLPAKRKRGKKSIEIAPACAASDSLLPKDAAAEFGVGPFPEWKGQERIPRERGLPAEGRKRLFTFS
jgi:hypothetical protein